MALRVIAGSVGGRKLVAPKGVTRPTQDRVKEALFSSLGDVVVDAVVLDLYAGSGALAIEALSRGAAQAVLVDPDRAAAVAIEAALYVGGGAPGGPFDLVVLDPPYDTPSGEVAELLVALAASGALRNGATVVVERPAGGDPVPLPQGWDVRRERTYGDTLLLIVSV
jgi:16S rRNA (guanine966-N2)-methyltransferase